MDARIVEKLLEVKFKRLLGRQVILTRGSFVVSKSSGIRPEVYFHVSKLDDFGGVTAEGTCTTRRPTKGPSTFKGFREERPSQMIVKVTCLSGSYDILQEILQTVSPLVLLCLELVPGFSLGSLPDKSVHLSFDDFCASLASAELTSDNGE